ncbi:MAG: glycerophosphodiester phosphodiesterase [Austwickia sp.]|jgi:glycerophosphoryl diester phosphodiesterase|nr:glycerophosphodiester phosphodiesterase [Austwickia sp.]MBK8437487.1 glycerophosphodiester phosphodiesterase [Austwickia sp.]
MAPYLGEPPLALAHRGGSGLSDNLGLENTLAAFGRAVSLGYRYLETDVHATADGHLVAFHDERLDRVTDTRGAIADLTLAQVKTARVGGGEAIPTMGELFEAFPDARFNIDIKAPSATTLLWRLIDTTGVHDRVCVGSFSNRRLWRFRRLARGRVATSSGRLGVIALRFLPTWACRVVHTPAVAYQVPWTVGTGARRLTVVTDGFLRRAHALGKQVHVWTIDDPDQMRHLLDRGVDGIVTDRPDLLRDVLRERGLWTERCGTPSS